jgi:aminopeptidase N
MLLAEINYSPEEEEKLFAYAHGAFLDRYTMVSESIEGQTYVDADMEIIIDALDDPFWAIRELAVSNIYPNEYLPFITDNILALATEDEKSAVRAAALGRVADLDIDEERKLKLALAATGDSSYLVMGEGLMLLSTLDSEQALQVAREYMFEKNLNIRIAVWEILSTEGNPKDNDYFLEMFRQYTGWESYYLMIYYQEFLKHQTDLYIIQKGADQFRKIGENASADNWIAFFANSFLGGLYEYYNEMMDQQAPDVQETWQAAMEYIQEQLNAMSMGWEE